MSTNRLRALALTSGLALALASCSGGGNAPVPDASGVEIDAATTDAGGGGADASVDVDADIDAGIDAGIDASTLDAPTDPCALGCATGTYDVDANPLTGTCGCEYACTFVSTSDAYDATFTDDNCDGGDGIVDACVYVSASQGIDTQPGTRAAPRQTISSALQQAEMNNVPFVCLSGEVYSESYSVPDGISVVGSFDHADPDFRFRRKAGITTTVNGSTLP